MAIAKLNKIMAEPRGPPELLDKRDPDGGNGSDFSWGDLGSPKDDTKKSTKSPPKVQKTDSEVKKSEQQPPSSSSSPPLAGKVVVARHKSPPTHPPMQKDAPSGVLMPEAEEDEETRLPQWPELLMMGKCIAKASEQKDPPSGVPMPVQSKAPEPPMPVPSPQKDAPSGVLMPPEKLQKAGTVG